MTAAEEAGPRRPSPRPADRFTDDLLKDQAGEATKTAEREPGADAT
jgi:hypothetical protein